MPAEKFSISMPEGLLARVDEVADEDGVTRSAVIREAATRYVAGREAEQRDRMRRASVDRALDAFDAVARDWGADERSGVEYLRELRSTAGSGPSGYECDDEHD